MSADAATPVATSTEVVSGVGKTDPVTSEVDQEHTAVEKVEKQAPADPPSTPLARLSSELPSIIAEAGHGEMWGIQLQDESHVATSIVLEKFLRANIIDKKKDVAKAKAQLIEALKWRKKMEPKKLLEETEFDAANFGGLGYVTVYPQAIGKEIVTWNIYGGIKDKQATFGNVEE
jgi:hypothetical protein